MEEINNILSHMNNYYIAINDIADILYKQGLEYEDAKDEAEELVNNELYHACNDKMFE